MTEHETKRQESSGGCRLHELVRWLGLPVELSAEQGEVWINDVVQDTRRLTHGALFVARDGARYRATEHLVEAQAAGAVAVLVDEASSLPNHPPSLPILPVSDLPRALARAAEWVHGAPTSKIPVVGITGTNGKTTTVALVERAIMAAGGRPARLGTLGRAFDGKEDSGTLTTPEADDISRFAAEVVRGNGTHLIMEVSSHSLALGRVSSLTFEVGAFTNLTQDHLDFHGSMAHYCEAKRRLFEEHGPRVSVLNVADPTGRDYAATARSPRILRVGRVDDVDVRPVDIVCDARGLRGDVLVAGRRVRIDTRLVGEHNLDNILLALGILEGLGIDLVRAVEGWRAFSVPGRLERCDEPSDPCVVLVDYAHTPDALERALLASRPLTEGRLICVMGCGGDRDRRKRPLMGEVAGRLADWVVVTNDNPRTESPSSIAEAIVEGLSSTGTPFEVELDRALAIQHAIALASRGDVVVIAGKGHEPYQEVERVRYPFDDRVEARRALDLLLAQRGL